MTTEVEIKAWVDDPQALRQLLAEHYHHERSYLKEDVYYRLPGGKGIEFRLRVEEKASMVTAKRKSLKDGVEVNEEMEFHVSDAAEFERFAGYLGATVFARKRKSGDRYDASGTTIELSHVDRLGHFVEIERLVDDADSGRIRAAEREVRSLLGELGIPEEKVEPRYYTAMLAELDS